MHYITQLKKSFSGVHAPRTLDKRGNFIKYILQKYNIKTILGEHAPIPLTSAQQYTISIFMGAHRNFRRGDGASPKKGHPQPWKKITKRSPHMVKNAPIRRKKVAKRPQNGNMQVAKMPLNNEINFFSVWEGPTLTLSPPPHAGTHVYIT